MYGIEFVKGLWKVIITLLFFLYIVIMLCFLMMFAYLDKHKVNPYISTPKKLLWACILPFHNRVRDAITLLRLRKPIRQPFYIGQCKQAPESLQLYLQKHGFEPTKIAWKDEGEVLSLRKIQDRIFQHHVRVFDDGQIRGHFEYTPESHMIKHVLSVGMVPSLLLEKIVRESEIENVLT